MQTLKLFAATLLMAIWGPSLLYSWLIGSAPAWAQNGALRKVYMLDRTLEPTFFTLLFGSFFTLIALVGVFSLITGKRFGQPVG